MGRKFLAKGPDDEILADGDSVEELVDTLSEKAGLRDAEDYVEEYDDGF